MSVIGWHRLNPSPVVNTTAKPIEKHEYVPSVRAQQDFTDAHKEVIRGYNSLRAKLLEAGLMGDKD